MGPVRTRNVEVQKDFVLVEYDDDATTVWDAESPLFAVAGGDWSDEKIGELVKVFRRGMQEGERTGRIQLQAELRRLLDAPASYEVHSDR